MKRILPAALAAALALPGFAHATEADLRRAFESVCLRTAAAPAASLTAARAQGFVAPPAAALDKFQIAELPNAKMVWKTSEGALSMVITGEGPISTLPGLDANLCAVMDLPGSGDPTAALQSILGIGAPQSSGGQQMFIYEDAGGTRKVLDQADGANAMRVMGAGTLRMALGMNRDGASMMMLIAPKPPK